MKRIFNEIAYYALLPLAGIAYVLIDKFKEKEREHEQKETFTTAYPRKPAKDFNNWIQYIHKQRK